MEVDKVQLRDAVDRKNPSRGQQTRCPQRDVPWALWLLQIKEGKRRTNGRKKRRTKGIEEMTDERTGEMTDEWTGERADERKKRNDGNRDRRKSGRDELLCTGIFLLTEYFVLEYPY